MAAVISLIQGFSRGKQKEEEQRMSFQTDFFELHASKNVECAKSVGAFIIRQRGRTGERVSVRQRMTESQPVADDQWARCGPERGRP